MTRQEIIDELSSLKEPKRLLDQAIAVLFKYQRVKTDLPTRDGDQPRYKITWYHPDGEALGEVPRFTENIDAAKSLTDYALPNVASGFGWDENGAYAKSNVEGGEAVRAFNIATALCLVAVKAGGERS